jgi:hypothetical protein
MLAELWDAADGDARRSAVGAQWLAFTLAKLGKKLGRINVRKGHEGRFPPLEPSGPVVGFVKRLSRECAATRKTRRFPSFACRRAVNSTMVVICQAPASWIQSAGAF